MAWLFSRPSSSEDSNGPESVRPQYAVDHERSGSRPGLPVASNISPSPAQSGYPQRGENRTPTWKKVVEISVALGTLGLLLVNIFLWKTTRESLISVQRAFLTYEGTRADRFENRLPNGNRWVFDEQSTNNGTTPAIHVMQHFEAEELPQGLSEERFIGTRSDIAQAKSNIGTVGPKGQLTIGPIFKSDVFVFGKEMTVDWKHPGKVQAVEMRRGVFFWGWIAYRDVFPQTPPHLVEFCQELSGIIANTQQQSFRVAFANCAEHNCTDESCQDYRQIVDAVF